MQSMTASVKTKVSGLDKIKELFHFRHDIKPDVSSNIDIHANTSSVDNLNHTINHLRSDLSNVNKTVKDLNDSGNRSFKGLGHSAHEAQTRVGALESVGHKIHGVFSGTFLGTEASQAIGSITSSAKSAITSGIKLVSVGRDTSRAWRNVGLNKNQANQMTEQMDDIRDKAGMDEQSINMMQKSFYSLTGSAPKAQSLTNELVSFGKATGESDRMISRMGRTLPRMLSTGKVSGQMFNRTFRQSPKLIGAIAKASGHTTGQFRQLAANGKITSTQLMQYMQKAAKGSSAAWAEYTTTFQGQMNVIKGTWTKAKENFARPFVSNLTRAVNQATRSGGGLLKVQKTAAKLSTTLGRQVGNWSGKAIGWIVKNQKPLMRTGSALFRIIKAIGSGVWKEFTSILSGLTGGTGKTTKGFNNFSKSLSRVASHTKQLQRFGRVLANLWLISKMQKFNKGLINTFHTLTKFKIVKSLQTKLRGLNKNWQNNTGILHRTSMGMKRLTRAARQTGKPIRALVVHGFRRLKFSATRFGRGATLAFLKTERSEKNYNRSLRQASRGQRILRIGLLPLKMGFTGVKLAASGLGQVLRHMPLIGWIQIAIDGLTELYMHSAKFRHLVNPLLRFVGKMIGKIGDAIADVIGKVIKWARGLHKIGHAVSHFFHHSSSSAVHASTTMSKSTRNAASRSTKSIHGYLSKSGKYYKHYHKGLVKISASTYKMRERMRSRYSKRTRRELARYEHSYRKYENKKSSLSRKYGKLRAMYSVKSLRLIEKRFRKLRSTILKITKGIYKDTRKWFKKIGKGTSGQFKGIYKAVRRWLGRSNKVMIKDYKIINKNSRHYLDGSIRRYVRELKYRFKRQRYYDGQLVKQTKRTNNIMNKLPLKWVYRETKLLNRNWKRQRKNFITHNRRMSKALITHIHTMSHHLRNFSKSFKDIFGNLESNIYDKWLKFWKKMHNAAGRGINSVQNPLNTGASHLNSFVGAFGETSAPLHRMPSVSYATGTGALSGVSSIRRPITRLTSAILNDDNNNGQETVIHANGSVEKPQGPNVHEMLEPGAEVLNASETKLMDALSQPVHFAAGTGFFNDLIKAFTGAGNLSQSILYSRAHGKGKHRLLSELQDEVLKNPLRIISGMFGSRPRDQRGYFNDVAQGAYSKAGQQAQSWFKTLAGLISKTLDENGSSSDILNYAIKHWTGVPYRGGGVSQSAADCGGAVQSILKHFGINVPHVDIEKSPAVRFVGTDESKARPGDLVGFGKKNHTMSGMSSHIGIYEHGDTMWSEHPPKSGPESIKEAAASDGLWGFYRIKNAPQDNKNPLKGVKTNSALGRFVKSQESPMLKWIQKHLAPLLDFSDISGTAGAWTKPGTQAHHIAEDVFEAAEHVGLDAKHAAAVVGNAWHESAGFEHGLKVNQFGGGGGKGLFQFTGQGSKYGWSPLGQVKSILANALGSSASSWEHSDGSPSSLAHSFETIFERGSIPAFAARDSAAERAYYMFGENGHAKGGRFNAGEMMTVGERGPELIKPDFSGQVIPHDESKRVINNSHKPVNVKQDIHIDVKGNSKSDDRHIVNVLQHYGDKLAKKLSGGDLVV